MDFFFHELQSFQDEIHAVSAFIHDHPELALNEFQAQEKLSEWLKGKGFQVDLGIGGLQTSFHAKKITGSGKGPHFGFLAEYDALPEIGHACGHNLICSAALAAGELAARFLQKNNIPAVISVFGTPGEETRCGKVTMLKNGTFDSLDAVLACHPYDMDSTDMGALSVSRYKVRFHGKASHAGSAPELGINALDAMIAFFSAVGLWRQQMPDSVRVHGIILNGGTAVNIIPDLTEAYMYVRSPNTKIQERMNQRFAEIVQGAALSTGCTSEIELVSSSNSILLNRPLNQEYAACQENIGTRIHRANGTEWHASTDFGDVSQIKPGANLLFRICEPGTPLHSVKFQQAAGTDFAFSQAMKCAVCMAQTGIRYITDDDFREKVNNDFHQQKKI